MKEFIENQIKDLENEIKEIRDRIEYNDSINQSVHFLGIKLQEKQDQLLAMKKFVEVKDAAHVS